jgi:hypothetical protein
MPDVGRGLCPLGVMVWARYCAAASLGDRQALSLGLTFRVGRVMR